MTDTDDPMDTSTIDERLIEGLDNIKSGIDRLQSDNTYLERRLDTLKSDNTHLKNRLERLQSERDERDDLQNRLAVAAVVLEKVIARLKRSGNNQWSLSELTALLALTTGNLDIYIDTVSRSVGVTTESTAPSESGTTAKSNIVYDEDNHIIGVYDPIKHKQAWTKSKDLSPSSPTIPTGASGPGTYTYKTTPTVPVGAVGPGSSDESEFFPSFWDGDLSNCPAVAWRNGGACDRDCGKTCRRW